MYLGTCTELDLSPYWSRNDPIYQVIFSTVLVPYKMHAESWELDLNSEFRVLTSWISLTLSSTIQNACNNKNDLKVGIDFQCSMNMVPKCRAQFMHDCCCTERAHQRLSKTSRFDRARWKSQQYTTRLPCSVSNSIDRFTENDLIFQVISSKGIVASYTQHARAGVSYVTSYYYT